MSQRGASLTISNAGHEPTWVGTITGVKISDRAGRNGEGTGRLRSDADGSRIAWRAPSGATFGPDVDVSSGGEHYLYDGDDPDKWVLLDVTAARLPNGPETVDVFLRDAGRESPLVTSDVTAAQASSGVVQTYVVSLLNTTKFTLSDVKAWLNASVVNYEISTDGASWVTPTSEDHADVLTLDTLGVGGSDSVHFRRTIAMGAASATRLLLHLETAFTIL